MSNFPPGASMSTIRSIQPQEVLTATRDINLWASKQLSTLKKEDPHQTYIFNPFTYLDQTGNMKGFLYPSTIRANIPPGPLFACKWVTES